MAMSTSGGAGGSGCSLKAAVPVHQLSRYESQKRRDWQTFTRYLTAHRPPLELRWCSGAHVLEFLRYLDRFGKTRVHTPPCPAYGGRATVAACQCPLRQAWGNLDALVGRLRAAFDEPRCRLGSGDQGGQLQPDSAGANPFAASAVRLYLRDIRDAQGRARGISYHKKKKQRKGNKAAPSSSKNRAGSGGAASEANARAHGQETMTVTTAPVPHLPPPCPTGLPFECCDFGSVVGGGAHAAGCYGGFYLPLLFNPSSSQLHACTYCSRCIRNVDDE